MILTSSAVTMIKKVLEARNTEYYIRDTDSAAIFCIPWFYAEADNGKEVSMPVTMTVNAVNKVSFLAGVRFSGSCREYDMALSNIGLSHLMREDHTENIWLERDRGLIVCETSETMHTTDSIPEAEKFVISNLSWTVKRLLSVYEEIEMQRSLHSLSDEDENCFNDIDLDNFDDYFMHLAKNDDADDYDFNIFDDDDDYDDRDFEFDDTTEKDERKEKQSAIEKPVPKIGKDPADRFFQNPLKRNVFGSCQ